MSRGKQDAAGQAVRRQQIIDYVKEHGLVKSGELCEALSLSRSSLSDDINAINTQAPLLLSPKRGYYTYNSAAASSMDDASVRGRIDRTHIRQWYILALASEQALTGPDILKRLSEENIACSPATLHTDLRTLKSLGLLKEQRDGTQVRYHSSVLCSAGNEELAKYRKGRAGRTENQRMVIAAYDSLERKLSHCIPGNKVAVKGSATRKIGKQNLISKEQLHMLELFEKFPYTEYALSIPYTTNRGIVVTVLFRVGMVMYSVETNRIYLIGKDDEDRNTIIALDRIRLDEVSVAEDSFNYIFESPEFKAIFDEMFHLSTEPAVRVQVRFQNLPFISAKVQRLCSIRPKASVRAINNDTELLYTDTLRGMDDFARYLRRFGRSVIADSPEELRERLIFTSRKTIRMYREEPEDGCI